MVTQDPAAPPPPHAESNEIRGAGFGLGVRLGIAILLVSVALDRAAIGVGGTNLRLEVIAAGLVLIASLARLRLVFLRLRAEDRRLDISLSFRRLPRLRLTDLDIRAEEWLLIAWLGVNVLSSLTSSPSRAGSLKLAIPLILLVSLFGLTNRLAHDVAGVVFSLRIWLLAGAAVAAIGIAASASSIRSLTLFGLVFEKTFVGDGVAASLMVRSTLWEPNVLGSFSATVALLALGLLLSPGRRLVAGRAPTSGVFGLSVAAVVLSASRASLMALLAGGAFLALAALLSRAPRPRPSALAAPLACAAIGIAAAAALASNLPRIVVRGMVFEQVTDEVVLDRLRAARQHGPSERLSPESAAPLPSGRASPPAPAGGPSTTGSASPLLVRLKELKNPLTANNIRTRLYIWGWALERWWERPWLGWGTGASRFMRKPPHWISNLEMHLLHDTGIVGTLAFLGAILLVVCRAWFALGRAQADRRGLEPALLGLLAGLVALGVAFQFTEATWLGFPWVLLGLVSATSRALVER